MNEILKEFRYDITYHDPIFGMNQLNGPLGLLVRAMKDEISGDCVN